MVFYLANVVADVALMYAAISGPDSANTEVNSKPPVEIAGYTNKEPLRKARIGVYWPYFEHCEQAVVWIFSRTQVDSCRETLSKLVDDSGAILFEIEIPDLNAMKVSSQSTNDRLHI